MLASLGLAAARSTETLQHLERLQRLRRRLDLAQAVVTRHIQSKDAPSQSYVTELHRIVVATPERSPMRVAFSRFLQGWQSTLRGAPRSPKADATPADPSTDPSK